MKTRPIIFSGPMVHALLDGRKTMTRRVVKPQPPQDATASTSPDGVAIIGSLGHAAVGDMWRCPYGRPGDLLWVRETWAHYQTVSNVRRPDGRAFAEVSDGLAGYRADGHDTIDEFREHVAMTSDCDVEAIEINGDRWRPSIHMPRWASRLTLRVTDVLVERVQDISEEDAMAEGVDPWGVETGRMNAASQCEEAPTYVEPFRDLWNAINGPDAWARNDWVWVVSFDVILANVDALAEAA